MPRRPDDAGEARSSLERALDWLVDGVVLIRADGAIVYANDALRAIARRNDGVRIRRGLLDFADTETRVRFYKALAGVCRPRSSHPKSSSAGDFPIPRSAGGSPYLVSMRPLMHGEYRRADGPGAVAIVFLRDPTGRSAAALRTLREVFGLTEAEARLAQALQAGVKIPDYARAHALSLNTVYTHLRRIKEKTGCHRMAELVRKLNDLQVPLRID